jgi:hypothetical protein
MLCGGAKLVDRLSLGHLTIQVVPLTVLLVMGLIPAVALGTVTALNIRNMALRTDQGQLVVIPVGHQQPGSEPGGGQGGDERHRVGDADTGNSIARTGLRDARPVGTDPAPADGTLRRTAEDPWICRMEEFAAADRHAARTGRRTRARPGGRCSMYSCRGGARDTSEAGHRTSPTLHRLARSR